MQWSYFTNKISVILFGSGSDRCGSGSCLQIYRFHIPDFNVSFFRVPCLLEKSSQRIVDACMGRVSQFQRFYTVRHVLGADMLGSGSNFNLVIMTGPALHYILSLETFIRPTHRFYDVTSR